MNGFGRLFRISIYSGFCCLAVMPQWLFASETFNHAAKTSLKKPSAYLSLHFKAIAVSDLLALLAEWQGLNLILSPAVQGTLTLHLEEVSWQQAWNAVLSMQDLAMHQEGKIIWVAPAAEMAAQQKLETALILVRYAKASDLKILLQAKNTDLLSNQASVIVDERTNQLWIKDTAERLLLIHKFLQKVDIPAKQVQIAARIIHVDESCLEELGLKFGTLTGDKQSIVSGDQLHMDMPLAASEVGHFSLAIAKLGRGRLLDLELSALERQGRARTISNPRLITTNRQPATIESGQQIPYQEKTASGATNVAFKKAVLSLKVTPEITPENHILLTLMVTEDKLDPLTVNGVPVISTQQLQSQVLLKNGEAMVVGGIYEQRNRQVLERVPFWSAIPLVGKLFTNRETHFERKELLVFVTPKIVEEAG